MHRAPLFCFPYSGASAMVYRRWQRAMPHPWEIRPVELPGRGTRMAEPLQDDLRALAREGARTLAGEVDGGRRYALFGHSLGALLAMETAHAMRELGASTPDVLIVSGTGAPATRPMPSTARTRTDAELVGLLRRLEGTPEAVFDHDELLQLLLPVLRADLAMCDGYAARERMPLGCPLHAFGGRRDTPDVGALDAWRRETRGAFALHLFDGHHFFIHAHEPAVLRTVASVLAAPRSTVTDARLRIDE